MIKYDYQRSIRMTEPVKESLEKICEVYRVNESDYIRTSLEKCHIADIEKNGIQPTFSSLFHQTA